MPQVYLIDMKIRVGHFEKNPRGYVVKSPEPLENFLSRLVKDCTNLQMLYFYDVCRGLGGLGLGLSA